MGIKQQAWINKIKSWIPEWFYLDKQLESAFIIALAKILESSEIDMNDQIAMTFVDSAISSFLDLHGSERSIQRVASEFDSSYRERIKVTATKSNVDKVSLKALVDKLLINGECVIKDDFENNLFFNRNEFFNRGAVAIDKIENTFSIIIDKQTHDPFSFMSRNYFFDRESFIGHFYSSDDFYNLIVSTVNQNKALGTLFRVIERI